MPRVTQRQTRAGYHCGDMDLRERFLASPFWIGMGAGDAAFEALRLGLKPVVREIVSRTEWERRRPGYEAAGYTAVASPMAVEREGDSELTERTGAPAASDRVIVSVGRDPAATQEVVDLETSRFERRSGRDGARKNLETTTRIGQLLGYPACCVEFVAPLPKATNRELLAAALRRTRAPHALLNNLSLSIFHYIPWYPCRYDCPASIEYAVRLDAHYASAARAGRDAALRLMKMPRLYLDERRQLIFDGRIEPDGGTSYGAVYTPYAFDRVERTRELEWSFYAEYAARFRSADRFRVEPGHFELLREGVVVDRVPRPPEALWFPFSLPENG